MDGQSSGIVAQLMSKDDDDEMDKEQRRLEDSEDCLQQVLTIPHVCEKIASFLSLNDMKAASEVSRHFLQAMRGTQRFAQKAVLAITDKNPLKSTLEKTEYSWRGVRIDVTDSSDILDDLPRVLKSAQFVCLGAPEIKNVWRAEDPTAARLFTIVLNSTPALSHLQIDTRFLCIDLRTVLSSPAVQETLRNLNRLEILDTTEYDECNPFERNFRLLTELPNRLKTFYLTALIPAPWKDSANQSVLRLLRNNTRTMEELSVHGSVWVLQELGTLTFPVLKTLSANVCDYPSYPSYEKEKETLAEFLENQRSLEELTIWFDESLVPLIQRRCMELRKLDMNIEFSFQDEWTFLGSMNRLKEFGLRTWGTYETGNSLLASLPNNQLECLSLDGLWDMWGTRRGVKNEFHFKTELLQGFRCLRKLSFLECLDAVDDQLMQWILKEFVLLEELEITESSTLTDAGISGNTTAEWGRDASFADLRRLETLKVWGCVGVTPNGVLASCVNVPSLRSLQYSNPPGPIVESVVMNLVEQNPRLERLILDYQGDLDYNRDFGAIGKLKAKVTKRNARVQLSLANEDDE